VDQVFPNGRGENRPVPEGSQGMDMPIQE
jgi:hypothetical protein